jgi:hypothetical protein
VEIHQLVQIVGAMLILAGFVGGQFRLLDPHSGLYLGLNEAGALVLAAVAGTESDWGFLLLEGAWAAVTAWSIVQLLRGARPAEAQ